MLKFIRISILLFALPIQFVTAQVTADFTSSSLNICAGSYVHFKNISTGNITSCDWDLGNGDIRPGQDVVTNITTQYPNPGTFAVTLTVTDGPNTDVKTVSVVVTGPSIAPPVFSYDPAICMYDYGIGNLKTPTPNPSLGGTFSTLETSLTAFIDDASTGSIRTSNSIPPGTYPIFYQYTSGSCQVVSEAKNVTLNNIAPMADPKQSPAVLSCNVLNLDADAAIAGVQWQYSIPGNTWQNFTQPNNNKAAFTTPTLTQTTKIRAWYTAIGCIWRYSNEITYIVNGTSTGGNATVDRTEMCTNTSPNITLSGFFGNVTWQKTTTPGNPASWTAASGAGATVNFTYGDATVTGFTPDGESSAGTMYYRASVNYAQTGSNCVTDYSNPIAVTYSSCTVTAVIVNTLTSALCVGPSGVGVYFDENSLAVSTPTPGLSSITGWEWDFPSSTAPSPLYTQKPGVITFDEAGIHTISLKVYGPGGISHTAYTTVTIDGLSDFQDYSDNSPALICSGFNKSLTVNSDNSNPSIQWQQSVSGVGYTDIVGATSATLNLTSVTVARYYRTIIKNASCPAITTPGLLLDISVITIAGISPASQVICKGNSAVLTISSTVNNTSSVQWQRTTNTTSGWSDISGEDQQTLNTGGLLVNTYFRARIRDDAGGCPDQYSYTFTVNVTTCGITPVISVSGNGRICFSNPVFNYRDITPTLAGVNYTQWKWDFGADAFPPTLTTNTGAGSIDVTYSTEGVKTVSLTITGVSGSFTNYYISSEVVTIDGVPFVNGFTSTGSALCAGSSANLFHGASFPAIGSSGIRWYATTVLGTAGQTFTPSGGSFHSTPPLNITTEYYITASNGVCPIFTTPSVVVTITSQPVISSFDYSNPVCESVIVPIMPNLTTNGYNTYANFSSSPVGLTIDANTGVISANYTSQPGTYNVSISIPPIGGCLPVSTTTSVIIGRYPNIPNISYGLSPYCNNTNSVSPFVFGLLPAGAYSSTFSGLGFSVSSTSGVVNLATTVPEDIYTILYTANAQEGCPAVSRSALLSVTGLPATPYLGYDNFSYCNGVGTIPAPTVSGITPGDGVWSINPSANISISGVNGEVYVSSLTSRGFYSVTYTKPARGGCLFPVSNFTQFYVDELPRTPIFNYGSNPLFCTNTAPFSAIVVANVVGGQFTTSSTGINVNLNTGEVGVNNLSVNGEKEIQYVIAAGLVCPQVVGRATLTLTGIPSTPDFNYPRPYVCNRDPSIQSVISVTGTTSGGYFYITTVSGGSSPMALSGITINPQSGDISISSIAGEGFYNVRYIASVTGCSVTTVPSTFKTLFIQQNPPIPFISYGSFPYCNNSIIPVSTSSNLLNPQFRAPSGLSYNPADGKIFPTNAQNGIFIVTVTNSSIKNEGGLLIQECPDVSSTATLTIGSSIGKPVIVYDRLNYCEGEGEFPMLSTVSGGTFVISPPTGLSFNTLTGVITISSSLVGSPSSQYDINYRIDLPNGCDPVYADKSATITIYKKKVQPQFSYPKSEYCQDDLVDPIASGQFTDGYFVKQSGLSIKDSIFGEIALAASSPGTYQLEYRVKPFNNVCPILSTTFGITIHKKVETPVINYGTEPFCRTKLTARPLSIVNGNNGTFAGTGFTINPDSGIVNLSSMLDGAYPVTYTNPSQNGCRPQTSDPVLITVSSPVSAPSIEYLGNPYCNIGIAPVSGDYAFGLFKSSKSIVIDSINGEVDLERSVGGEYTVTYVVPPIAGCAGMSDAASITINKGDMGIIETVDNVGKICGGNSVKIRITNYFKDLVWQEKRSSVNQWVTSGGTFDPATKIFTTTNLIDSVWFRAYATIPECPTQEYSDSLLIRVEEKSKGGSAIADTTLLCNRLSTKIGLFDYKGKIQWQFSRDSIGFSDLIENKTVRDSILITPNQNQYGSVLYYRAKVQNGECPEDYSNTIGIRVCDAGFFIPNILTPETNNATSTWSLYQLNLRDYAEIRIYNIYGVIVAEFRGADFNKDAFGGWNGGGLPTGAYWYLIDKKDGTKEITGSITILK